MELLSLVFENFHEAAINTRGHHYQVIIVTILVGTLHAHEFVFANCIRDQSADEFCALLLGQFQQVAIKAMRIQGFGVQGSVATIDGGDTLLHQGRGNFHIAHVHV